MANQPPIQQSQQPPPHHPSAQSPGEHSWEGDRMFNIYIYDYCSKRGFKKTAKELMVEADIPPDPVPPINAKQGLLFEWWSVFWVLFQAKSSHVGTDDALLYTTHQSNIRNAPRIPNGPGNPALPATNGLPQPTQPPPLAQSQAGMARMPSNMTAPSRPGPGGYLPNGTMTNGVLTGQPSVHGGTAMPFNLPPQVNGGPGPSSAQPQPPHQQFNHMMQGNRPTMNGVPQPSQQQPPLPTQRPPTAGGAPFPSPPMAHSPQTNPTPGHPGQQAGPSQGPGLQQGHPSGPAPMAQLVGRGPSPQIMHNRGPMPGGMHPPNGMMSTMGQQSGGPPTPGYAPGLPGPPHPGGRPPSRANTPGGGMMAQASPSLANRMPQQPGPMNMVSRDVNGELMALPVGELNAIKSEIGLLGELHSLAPQDKSRLLAAYKTRMAQKQGVPHPATGPQGMMSGQQQPQPPQQRPPSQQMRSGIKRSSTSPGEEHESLPGSDGTPPERKRLRTSPPNQGVTIPPGYAQPHQGQPHPGLPGQPGPSQPPIMGLGQQHQQPMNMIMRGQMPMNGAPAGPPPQIPGAPAGVPQMAHMMGGQMQNMGMHPNPGMPPQMQHQAQMQFRQQPRPMNPPGGPGHAPSPVGGDPSFNPGGGPPPQTQTQGLGPAPPGQFNSTPLNRMGQPPKMGPPAMNGQAKDGLGKAGGGAGGSPRNQPTPGGTAPPTPVSNPQQPPSTGPPGSSQGQAGAPSQVPGGGPSPGLSTNPMQMITSPPTMMGSEGLVDGLFSFNSLDMDNFQMDPGFLGGGAGDGEFGGWDISNME